MANGINTQQFPPAGGPTPQPGQLPPMPNVAQLLGQLATSPPVGPIPVTPPAAANVGPLAMPGAGLAGPQTMTPPWTGGLPKHQQSPFGNTLGAAMQPGTRQVGRDGHDINMQPPGQRSPQMMQLIQQLLGGQQMPAAMTQPIGFLGGQGG